MGKSLVQLDLHHCCIGEHYSNDPHLLMWIYSRALIPTLFKFEQHITSVEYA